MDLAVYIDELLSLHGELKVPGMGTFKRIRVKSYYDVEADIFYPPHYQAHLDTTPVSDDGILVQYISNRNGVSIGSARYFVNKYINDLLHQSFLAEVSVKQLGWLHQEAGQLKFRTNISGAANPVRYGFTPVSLQNQPEPIVIQQKPAYKAMVTEPKVSEQPITVSPVLPPAPVAHDPVFAVEERYDGPVPKRHSGRPDLRQKPEVPAKPNPVPTPVQVNSTVETASKPAMSNWIVVGVILLVLVLGGVIWYKTLVDRQANDESKRATNHVQGSSDAGLTDTVIINHGNITGADTPVNTQANTNNTAVQTQSDGSTLRYVLIGGSYDTPEQADAAVRNYQAQGIAAKIYKSNPGRKITVSIGSFDTYTAAQAEKLRLVKLYHLTSSNLYVDDVNESQNASAAPSTQPVTTPTGSGTASELPNAQNYKFALMSGAFNTDEQANEIIKRYHERGINASAYKNAKTSKFIKIALGYYSTYAEGMAAKQKLVQEKKLKSRDLYVETLRNQ